MTTTNKSNLRQRWLSQRRPKKKSRRKTSVKVAMSLESGWEASVTITTATRMMTWKRMTYLKGSLERTPTPLQKALKRRMKWEPRPLILQTSLTKTVLPQRDSSPTKWRHLQPLQTLPNQRSSWTSLTGFPLPLRHQPPKRWWMEQQLQLRTLWDKREPCKEAKNPNKKTKNRVLNNLMFLSLTQGNDLNSNFENKTL